MPPKRQVQDQGEEEVEDIALPEGGDVSKLLKEMNIPDDVLRASLVQAMQAGLQNLVGTSSGYIESLPRPVKSRIAYLESLQADYDAAEEALNEEIKALERKYKPTFDGLFEMRRKIVVGEDEVPEEHAVEEEEEEEEEEAEEGDMVGIPDFWMIALSNNPLLGSLMEEKDSEIMASLVDVSCEDILDEDGDEKGYRLNFTFKENQFFSNKVLSLRIELYQEGGMMQVDELEGTKINWHSDSVNPTIKVMKKKKSGQGKKPAIKKEKVESFFNIFSPPELEDIQDMEQQEAEAVQEEIEKILAIGESLREDIIPHAVNWFTGEAAQEESEDEDDYDDDDEDEDDDDDLDEYSEDDGGSGDDDGEWKAKPADLKDPECKQQ